MHAIASSRIVLPGRHTIAERLAALPPLEELLTADDLEKQQAAAQLPLKPVAVLLLVVNHAEPTVLFTQRTTHLADHAGQIALPGGRCDEGYTDQELALMWAKEDVRRWIERFHDITTLRMSADRRNERLPQHLVNAMWAWVNDPLAILDHTHPDNAARPVRNLP